MDRHGRRNFEAGIFTSEPNLVDAAAEHFDRVWRGAYYKTCGRKQFCGVIIAK